MNIKSRLLLYNLLIILISSILMIFIFTYASSKSNAILYNPEMSIIDDNINKVKGILLLNKDYKIIDMNLKQYNYKLYIYNNKSIIYGETNEVLEQLINNLHHKKNGLTSLFINNQTIIMKVDNNIITFAVHQKEERPNKDFLNRPYNPFLSMITNIICFIILSLLIVLSSAIYFSNKILKKVMKPLDLLREGSEKIEDGDYNTKIVYDEINEFTPVIDNFNKMQESLRIGREKQESYQKAKLEMINGISHDIRTPLTVVKGNIKGIKDGIAKTKDKKDKYLDVAYNRVLDIENLLNRLFETFNYETNQIKLNKEKIDLNSFVKEIIYNNENVINKIIDINLDIDDNKNYVYIDSKEFKRVFDNLINNSIKHNSNIKKIKITIKIWRESNLIKLSFKDNGNGVKEENIKNIFNEFFMEDTSRNGEKNSSGLGLFIVKKIIESHNGNIIAKNKKGLYFEITLKGDEIIG